MCFIHGHENSTKYFSYITEWLYYYNKYDGGAVIIKPYDQAEAVAIYDRYC